jgi:glycerophosphoryl diester phosphodiesterase
VLERYQQRAFLDIELKVSGLEKTVAGLLGKCPPRRGWVVSSFLPEVLQAVHAADSAMPLGIICENRAELERRRELPVEYVIPHRKLVTRGLLNELKAANRRVLVWTVNEREEMRRLAEWGADGIVSDDTRLLGNVFEK